MSSPSAHQSILPVKAAAHRPTVSIVTASFNVLDPLKATVASVAAQKFRDIEHVIVDGASTDGTSDYLPTLGPETTWVSETDDGIADAMNKGIRLARGHWIIVLQAGDTFVDEKSLEQTVGQLVDDTDILTCGILYGSQSGHREISYPNPKQRLTFKPIAHQGAFMRRSVAEKVGGFDASYRVCMDYEFFLRARNAGSKFAAAPIVVARMDDGGISSRRDWASQKMRFAEERRAQLAHCPNVVTRVVYAIYWPLYLGYRRLRLVFSGEAG